MTSKMSFNKGDTSLGRIETLSVPPPHTFASLKSCLTKYEGVSAHDLQVFEDDTGEITMKDGDIIALLTDAYPGNVEEQPIAIMYKEKEPFATFTNKLNARTLPVYDYNIRLSSTFFMMTFQRGLAIPTGTLWSLSKLSIQMEY